MEIWMDAKSPLYHELATTDKELAESIAAKYEKTSTFITIHRSASNGKLKETVYKVSWEKERLV